MAVDEKAKSRLKLFYWMPDSSLPRLSLAVTFPSSSVASRLLFKQRLESEGRVGTGLLAACQMLRDLILSPSYAPHSPWGSGAAAGHMPAGTVVGVGG